MTNENISRKTFDSDMIHIIMPVYNRLSMTRQCLNSLDKQNFDDWCVYIVNDGSTDGTKEWIETLNRQDVKCINGDGSLWWTGSMKAGVEHVLKICDKKDYIMSLNNDLVFRSENSLSVLLTAIISNNKSICGSVSVSNLESEIVMSSGSKMISWFLNISFHPFVGSSYHDIENNPIRKVDMLTGRSVIYPAPIFNDINFDSVCFPQYGGDNEFTIRAKRVGYDLFLVPGSAVLVNRSETGLNPMDRRLSLKEKLNSLFSVRSVNNIMIRTRFAMRVPPVYARPTYFIISMMKIFIQLLIGNFIAKRNGR